MESLTVRQIVSGACEIISGSCDGLKCVSENILIVVSQPQRSYA